MIKNIISLFLAILLFFPNAVDVFSGTVVPDAEILLNERKATIHPDGTMETLTHRIIKVNTYQGIERYKKLDITYNKDYDEVIITKVQRLIPTDDGKYIPENQNVKTTSGITNQTGQAQALPLLYLDTKTITMPIEKPDDIFEYEIIVKRFKPLIKDHFWNVHVFNDIMPVQKSIFTVSIPNVGAGLAPALYYKAYNIQLESRIEEKEGLKIYTWEKDNLPAISVTEGSNPTPDMLLRVVISSTNTWDDIANWFNTIYEDKIIADEKIQKKVQSLIENTAAQRHKDPVGRDFHISPLTYTDTNTARGNASEPFALFVPSRESAVPHSTLHTPQSYPINPVNPVEKTPKSNFAPFAPLRESTIPPSAISHQPSTIQPLFDYVAYSIPFLGNELGKGAFIPRPAPDVLLAHQGDCKDKVVLLTTMLRTAGIEAYPALLNSVSDIPIKDQLPTPYYFNHAIVYVPAQKSPTIDLAEPLWLDPTISTARYNFLPLENYGKTALVLNKKQTKFMPLQNYIANHANHVEPIPAPQVKNTTPSLQPSNSPKPINLQIPPSLYSQISQDQSLPYRAYQDTYSDAEYNTQTNTDFILNSNSTACCGCSLCGCGFGCRSLCLLFPKLCRPKPCSFFARLFGLCKDTPTIPPPPDDDDDDDSPDKCKNAKDCPDDNDADDLCDKESNKGSICFIRDGSFLEDYSLPITRSLGTSNAITLVYYSVMANPHSLIQTLVNLDYYRSLCPASEYAIRRSAEFKVLDSPTLFTLDIPEGLGYSKQSFLWNGTINNSIKPTGVYSYTATITTKIKPKVLQNLSCTETGCTITFGSNDSTCANKTYPSYIEGKSIFRNYINSPFGAGWTLDNLQQLHFSPDGSILLTNANSAEIYSAPTSANPNLFPSSDGESTLIKNPDNSFTRTLKDKTIIAFNTLGLQTSITDKNDNTTTYEYDATGKLLKIIDPLTQTTSFFYNNTTGLLEKITDPVQRETIFAYDSNGNLTSITDPSGAVTSFTYDDKHLMTSETSPRNFTEIFEYNEFGMIKKITLPTGETKEFKPALAQMINKAINITNTRLKDEVIDGKGFKTIYKTNTAGASTQIIDPLGRKTSTVRNSNNQPLITTKPDGTTVEMSYDTMGNLIAIQDNSTGAKTTFSYEPTYNQIKTITNPNGAVTTMNYDSKGNPTEIINAMQNKTTMTYNEKGLITSIKDPLDNITSFTYNDKWNLSSITDALNNKTEFSYDTAGNITTVKDAKGQLTTFEYNAMNRLTKATDAQGGVTQYQYDEEGNLTAIIDAKGQQTAFEYNEINQLAKITNPKGETKTFNYDLNRNLTSVTDAKGQTTAFEYDAANRLIRKNVPDNISNYIYDIMDNLLEINDNDSKLRFEYDATGRLIKSSTDILSVGSSSTGVSPVDLSYAYDLNGNRTSITDQQGEKTDYTYDVLDRLVQLANPQTQLTKYFYDALSRRTKVERTNGITTNYSYDVISQLLALQNVGAGLAPALISEFNYSYDTLGNRTKMKEKNGENIYGYDALSRLIDAAHPQTQQPANPNETFAYDPLGNRTLSHISTTYSYDTANRLLEDNAYTYTYDNNGNLTEKLTENCRAGSPYPAVPPCERMTFAYNSGNQLTKVEKFDGLASSPTLVANYKYDGLGRRIAKEITTASGTFITKYVMDAEDIIAEYDGNNNLVAKYIHGPGIDEPIAMLRDINGDGSFIASETFYFVYDGLGSVTALTDASGTVVMSYVYNSFGQIMDIVDRNGNHHTRDDLFNCFILGNATTSQNLDCSLLINNPYTYTTREYDAESDLYYYRARYYDAMVGRFLQEDPKPHVNLYIYGDNNPINNFDPYGILSNKDMDIMGDTINPYKYCVESLSPQVTYCYPEREEDIRTFCEKLADFTLLSNMGKVKTMKDRMEACTKDPYECQINKEVEKSLDAVKKMYKDVYSKNKEDFNLTPKETIGNLENILSGKMTLLGGSATKNKKKK